MCEEAEGWEGSYSPSLPLCETTLCHWLHTELDLGVLLLLFITLPHQFPSQCLPHEFLSHCFPLCVSLDRNRQSSSAAAIE